MPFQFEWGGYDQLQGTFNAIIETDPMPLMEQWTSILVEGNRRGVLAGVDGHNVPMPPLKYRFGIGKKTKNRRVPNYGTTRFNTTALGFDDNLTTAQYQEYSGPRLAPRAEGSRVIKNLHTAINAFPAEHRWEAIAAWHHVVSKKGVPFLGAHFNGTVPNVPRYDLRPVRPEDIQFALNALRAFVKESFFQGF